MAEAETDCRQVLSALYTYLDGEQLDCAGIEAHLAACGDCLSHAEFEKALKAVVRKACGQADLPADLEGKIRSLLD